VQCEYYSLSRIGRVNTVTHRLAKMHPITSLHLDFAKIPTSDFAFNHTTFVANMSMISFTLISAPANSIGLVKLCRFYKITVLAFAMFFLQYFGIF